MFNVGNAEILQIAESVAREKGIAKENIILAMEQAIQTAGRRKYGQEHNIKAEISRKNGEIKLYKVLSVVEVIENTHTEISLQDAQEQDPLAKIDDEILELLPPIDLGRVAAQSAKQIIIQKVKEAEKEKQYEEFKDRVGEILSGTVKRVEFGNLVVDLGGRAEAVIKKDQLIKTESFKVNDRIKAYVYEVRADNKGPQIHLSRTADDMLKKLFELEVPEIYDNIIQVKAVARDPGSKAKIAVFSSDSTLDAVGACIGMRGNRVKSVTNELSGEKIDVIQWNKNIAQFVINAMAPAEISKIVVDEDKMRVEVAVPNEQLSIAIGRRGQNVRLASKLTGWGIDVMTEEQESKRRTDEFNSSTGLFMKLLNVEEVIAQLLTAEGFSTIEQIADIDSKGLSGIEGFDENLADEIRNRAMEYIDTKNNLIIDELEKLGVEQELIEVLDLSPENILKLAEYGIKTLEDLAEISVEEFRALTPNSHLTNPEINSLIKAAKQAGGE